eukprot:evm.model.scf_2504.3 EVM.evm.TU.scf_2504.3   scf_2504:17831-18778(-)
MATVEHRRELAGLASTAPSGLLRKVLEEARKMLANHEGPFEIQTFCSTSDTQKRVSKVCGALKALSSGFAPEYGKELRVDARVRDDEYCLDVQYLQYMLRYIFQGKLLGRVDRRLTAEWSGFKHQFDAQMQALGVIDENEICWKKGSRGTKRDGSTRLPGAASLWLPKCRSHLPLKD